ncbi:MAG: tetratricopeptide repeat protein, partial [Thermodesulfobacteriota bacterium]
TERRLTMPPFFIKVNSFMTKLNIIFFLSIVFLSFSLVYLTHNIKGNNKTQQPIESVKTDIISKDKSKGIINYLELKVKRRPSDFSNYNELAQAYLQKARETGDVGYYIKAEKSLSRSLEINPDSYIGNLYMAIAKQANHEFDVSIQFAEKAIAVTPEENYAYGVVGDAYIELGDIEKARVYYQKMFELKPSLESYGRLANLKAKEGDIEGAVKDMQSAYEAGVMESKSSENLAWAQARIGTFYLDKGNLEEAEIYFKKALEIMDNYYLALQNLAKINLEKKNYDEAERLYKKVIEINSRPEIHIALSDVYKKKGDYTLAGEHNIKAKEIIANYKKQGFQAFY